MSVLNGKKAAQMFSNIYFILFLNLEMQTDASMQPFKGHLPIFCACFFIDFSAFLLRKHHLE